MPGAAVDDARDTRTVSVPASATAVHRARGFVVETLAGWRITPATVDDLELITSELVTNAFVHGEAETVDIAVSDLGAAVMLQVAHREPAAVDDAPETAIGPMTVDPRAVHGRGLAIVDVLSHRWGVSEAGTERRVWAQVSAGRAGLLPAAERDTALADLDHALDHRQAGRRAVGDTVAAWAKRRLATAFAGVAVADDTPGHLRYLSLDPLPQDTATAWARFPVTAPAPVATAFVTAAPSFHETRSAAVASFPGIGPTLATAEVAAVANLPLLPGAETTGTPAGVLTLAWAHGQVVDPDDRAWLAAVARLTAAALTAAGPAD